MINEIRLDEYGELDEVVVGNFSRPRSKAKGVCVHLERMGGCHWWMRIDVPGRRSIAVNFWTKRGAKICARAEHD
jgi:hypothetical protein